MTAQCPESEQNPLFQHPVTFRVAMAFFWDTEPLTSASPWSWASPSTERRLPPSGNSRNAPLEILVLGGGRETERGKTRKPISYLHPQHHPFHPHQSWSEIKAQVKDSSLPFTSFIYLFSRKGSWKTLAQVPAG